MIKCHLSRILGAKRMSMTELSKKTGISRNTIYLLYHEKTAGITFATMEKLCTALEVQPGDLLEHIPETK